MLALDLALAARHHLVPGAVAGALAVDHQRQQRRARQVGARLGFRHRGAQFGRQQRRGVAGLQIVFTLPHDQRRSLLTARLRLGHQPRAFQRVQRDILASLQLQLEAMAPSGKFIGPGLDGIDITADAIRRERAAPAVVDFKRHRRAVPDAILLAAPHDGGCDDLVTVPVQVGKHLDRLAGDPLDRETPAVDDRIDVLDMESTMGGAFDGLSGFVHVEAIDMRMSSQFELRKRDGAIIYKVRQRALVPSGTELKHMR